MASQSRLRATYGAGPRHLVVLLLTFALATYAVLTLGLDALWNPDVWWQSILVWFVGAALIHDLLLFPVYAIADRVAVAGSHVVHHRGGRPGRRVPLLNHLRVPALASGLLLLVYFPGIIEQGADSYLRATGQTQDPFLARWLWLSAVAFAVSGGIYLARVARSRRQSGRPSAG